LGTPSLSPVGRPVPGAAVRAFYSRRQRGLTISSHRATGIIDSFIHRAPYNLALQNTDHPVRKAEAFGHNHYDVVK
jgi:hypothetical protein